MFDTYNPIYKQYDKRGKMIDPKFKSRVRLLDCPNPTLRIKDEVKKTYKNINSSTNLKLVLNRNRYKQNNHPFIK